MVLLHWALVNIEQVDLLKAPRTQLDVSQGMCVHCCSCYHQVIP